jgi:hypothetical protein
MKKISANLYYSLILSNIFVFLFNRSNESHDDDIIMDTLGSIG